MRISDVCDRVKNYMWNDRWLGRKHAPLRCKIGVHTPIPVAEQSLEEFILDFMVQGESFLVITYECKVCGMPCLPFPKKSSFLKILRSMTKKGTGSAQLSSTGTEQSSSDLKDRAKYLTELSARTGRSTAARTSASENTPANSEHEHLIPQYKPEPKEDRRG